MPKGKKVPQSGNMQKGGKMPMKDMPMKKGGCK